MLNRYSGISWYSYLKHKLNHSSISNLYLFLFLFLFLKLFHLFIFQILSPPGPPLPEFFTSYPSHLLLRRCSPPIVLCPPYPTLGISLLWLISSLLDQVHPLPLRTDKAVLCDICPGGHGPARYLFGWQLSLWELLGFQVSWHCYSSYGVAILFSSLSPSPNTSIGVPNLSPVIDCEYLHLSQSAAGRASEDALVWLLRSQTAL